MFAGVFDEFFGVPTHPIAVHAPVVLIPLLAVASVVVLFRTTWRVHASLPLAVLAFVMVIMLFVAKESGEAAKEANNVFGNIDRHEDLANQTFIMSIVWLVLSVVAGVAAFRGRREPEQESSGQVVLVLNVLSTLALIVTTVWLIRTGHAGAESRWVI